MAKTNAAGKGQASDATVSTENAPSTDLEELLATQKTAAIAAAERAVDKARTQLKAAEEALTVAKRENA